MFSSVILLAFCIRYRVAITLSVALFSDDIRNRLSFEVGGRELQVFAGDRGFPSSRGHFDFLIQSRLDT